MQSIIHYKKAGAQEYKQVYQLLQEENLPVVDLNPVLENFFVAMDNNILAGVIGMDRYGNNGLLRSAVVQKDYRNSGIAGSLVNQLFNCAKEQGVTTLYLITNTAVEYFKRKGFVTTTRDSVPDSVLQSKEFNGLCPASAVIMTLQLVIF